MLLLLLLPSEMQHAPERAVLIPRRAKPPQTQVPTAESATPWSNLLPKG
jgi:hypothetical protein